MHSDHLDTTLLPTIPCITAGDSEARRKAPVGLRLTPAVSEGIATAGKRLPCGDLETRGRVDLTDIARLRGPSAYAQRCQDGGEAERDGCWRRT